MTATGVLNSLIMAIMAYVAVVFLVALCGELLTRVFGGHR